MEYVVVHIIYNFPNYRRYIKDSKDKVVVGKIASYYADLNKTTPMLRQLFRQKSLNILAHYGSYLQF